MLMKLTPGKIHHQFEEAPFVLVVRFKRSLAFTNEPQTPKLIQK
jgi:hypothetical protein